MDMPRPRVTPRYPVLTAALRRALRATPTSLHRLAREAGVQARTLLRIYRGELGASPAVARAIAQTLLRWGAGCTEAGERLRRALRDDH